MIRPLKVRSFWFIIALTWAPLAFSAGEAQQRLENFLESLTTLKADFIQTLQDPKMEVIEESRGVLLLSRPHKFRLTYMTPYEQIYIADGRNLWLYDIDLEQISVKPQGDALGSTPALLLSGTSEMAEKFRFEEQGLHSGFYWLRLIPRDPDASFDSIRIAMEGDELRAMEMIDGFGQTTRLYLTVINRNPNLDSSAFQFNPPEGVDVIGTPE